MLEILSGIFKSLYELKGGILEFHDVLNINRAEDPLEL